MEQMKARELKGHAEKGVDGETTLLHLIGLKS